MVERNQISTSSLRNLTTVEKSQQPGRIGRCRRYSSIEILARSDEVAKAGVHSDGATCKDPVAG